ncbi:MAG: energy transducer TonB, partial [Flavobacteriales bacterium]
ECLFGRMEVSFLIDSKGFVKDVRVDRNETGHAEMEAVVLLAMKEISSFVPATLQGRNVESRLKVVISY